MRWVMLNNIMEAIFLQTGKTEVHKKAINPAVTLEAIKTNLRLPADKALELAWCRDSELPMLISDEPKLRRILECLLDNALKFTPEGTVSLRADYDPNRQTVAFTVQDTGIGFAAEAQKSISEIFR